MQATVQTARTMLLHFSMNLNFDCGSRLLLGVDCSTCFTSHGCYCFVLAVDLQLVLHPMDATVSVVAVVVRWLI